MYLNLALFCMCYVMVTSLKNKSLVIEVSSLLRHVVWISVIVGIILVEFEGPHQLIHVHEARIFHHVLRLLLLLLLLLLLEHASISLISNWQVLVGKCRKI